MRRLRIASLSVLLAIAGCTTWVSRPVPEPPAPFRSTRGPVHVVLMDQTSLYLVNVVIARDSLIGLSADVAALRYSLRLQDVVRIEEQRKDPTRSIILFLAIATALVVL